MAYDYDLFTVGAGSGGVRASRVSAHLGAKVAVAEEALLGGTCVNVGCIPKKLMVLAADYRDDFEDARAYGWTVGERRFDWPTFIAHKDTEIARLNGVYQRILEQNGVKIFPERATVLDPNTVRVGDREITARHILIATEVGRASPCGPGAELAITSNEIFHLPEQPKRVLIVGGGYIAVEFAGILHGMGTAVTQIYRGPLFLRGFDDDLREVLADEMRTREIDLRFGIDLKSIERVPGGLRVVLSDGMTLEVDQVLATPRQRRRTPRPPASSGTRRARGGRRARAPRCRASTRSAT
jgi:glutathione reductase (NADPH)